MKSFSKKAVQLQQKRQNHQKFVTRLYDLSKQQENYIESQHLLLIQYNVEYQKSMLN